MRDEEGEVSCSHHRFPFILTDLLPRSIYYVFFSTCHKIYTRFSHFHSQLCHISLSKSEIIYPCSWMDDNFLSLLQTCVHLNKAHSSDKVLLQMLFYFLSRKISSSPWNTLHIISVISFIIPSFLLHPYLPLTTVCSDVYNFTSADSHGMSPSRSEIYLCSKEP